MLASKVHRNTLCANPTEQSYRMCARRHRRQSLRARARPPGRLDEVWQHARNYQFRGRDQKNSRKDRGNPTTHKSGGPGQSGLPPTCSLCSHAVLMRVRPSSEFNKRTPEGRSCDEEETTSGPRSAASKHRYRSKVWGHIILLAQVCQRRANPGPPFPKVPPTDYLSLRTGDISSLVMLHTLLGP